MKWLRYYWDFCHKYSLPPEQQTSLPLFLRKLQEKGQTAVQQEQAAHAMSLYYALLQGKDMDDAKPVPATDDVPAESEIQASFERNEDASETCQLSPITGSGDQESEEPPAVSCESELHSGEDRGMPSETGQQSHTQPRVNRLEHRIVQRRVYTGRGASWKAEYERLAEVPQERDYPSRTARVYTKWVRKFQAFTRSQPPEILSSEDAGAFLVWLPQKFRMTVSQLHQVYDALLLFYRHVLQRELEVERPARSSASVPPKKRSASSQEAGTSARHSGQGASWQTEYTRLTEEIRTRHYSPKTLKTYMHWARKFQAFTKSQAPQTLTVDDVKAFLSYLAVKREVSASTQNQAFNALLFFFRHVLNKEFGEIDGVVRAKRKPYNSGRVVPCRD